jgi:hypothetical protein
MAQNTQSAISEESAGFLEDVRKGKPRRFVMICKGRQVVSLVVYKNVPESLWPYAKCKLLDFPKQVKGGLLTFGAAGRLEFGEPEVAELAVEVNELRKSVLERLSGELLASPEPDLAKNFKASAMTAEVYVVEALRAACQRLHEAKLRREGKSDPALWSPKPADIVLDWETWRKVIEAAKAGGWDQEENTGFTDSLKAYQKALETYEAELKKTPPNPTIVEQQRGLILGELDGLEKNLRKFKPVTRQKFYHPGLVACRDGMLELCLAERVKYGSALMPA